MLDRSHHMVNLVSESEQLGINTATELATQREKLEKIDNNLDTIDNTLIGTQQRINRLQSVFGGIKNYFYGPKTAFLPKSNSQPNMTKNQSNNTSSNKQQQQRNGYSTAIPKTDEIDTYLGKPRSAMDDLEKETNDALRDVHFGVNRLKNLALDLNYELEGQNTIINRVTGKVEVLD
ncbi:unnamed protein product, partial [Didymodactylos carnosus]